MKGATSPPAPFEPPNPGADAGLTAILGLPADFAHSDHRSRPVRLHAVQSASFDRYRRRVVVPLVCRTLLPRDTPTVGSRTNQIFVIEGIRVVLHPLDMVSVPLDQLGDTAGSLEKQGQVIADALDELLTRSWVRSSAGFSSRCVPLGYVRAGSTGDLSDAHRCATARQVKATVRRMKDPDCTVQPGDRPADRLTRDFS